MTTTAIPAGWDCARFEGALADLLEGELPAAERAAAEAHAAACGACGALVADLRAIATEASALPPVPPARDLWAGIEARLETPVVPLAHRAAGRPAPRATLSFSARRLAAAAAALVAVTSAGTWWLARGPGDAAPGAVAVAPVALATGARPPVEAPPPAAPDAPDAPAPTDADAPEAGAASGRAPAAGSGSAASAQFVRAGASAPRAAAPNAAAPAAPGAPGAAYDREIAELRATVRERRGELDPTTVAVLERNLAIIDAAIADSRSALAREPRSAIVGDQLQRALSRKVELLRTLATLPRT